MTEAIWGPDFIGTYMSLASNASIRNKEMHVLGMLTLLGQSLRNVLVDIRNQEIDLRIHCFSIQRSGSGKDAAFNFMKAVGEEANMVSAVSSLTSAALIGTVEKGGGVRFGAAKNSDIIAFKEASSLFYMSANEHSKDLINNLNMCIDVGGHIRKELAHQDEPIEYYTHISLFGTTYPPVAKNFYIDSGLLPRMLVSYKHINSEFYFKVVDWLFANVGTAKTDNYGDIRNLGQTIKVLLKETKDGFHFDFSNERTTLLGIANKIRQILSRYPITIQERAEPFISRMAVYSLKLSCVYCILDNMSYKITQAHIDQANAVVCMSFTSILDFISNHDIINTSDTVKSVNIVKMAVDNLRASGIKKCDFNDLFTKLYPNITSARHLSLCLDTLVSLKEVIIEERIGKDNKPYRVVRFLDIPGLVDEPISDEYDSLPRIK